MTTTLEAYYKALTKVLGEGDDITNGRSYNHSDTELLDYLEKRYAKDTGSSIDIREAIELLMEKPNVADNHYLVQEPDYTNDCSDVDYYGYEELDFTVYDRKGYKAPWLEKRMSDQDVEKIKTEIVCYMQDRSYED